MEDEKSIRLLVRLAPGFIDTDYVDRMQRFYSDYSNYTERYPEMAHELRMLQQNHISRATGNYYTLGNQIADTMRTHWKLAPPDVIGRLMLQVIGEPKPYELRLEEVVNSLSLMLNLSRMAKANIIMKSSTTNPQEIAFQTIMTYLPDMCIELLPSIIFHMKTLMQIKNLTQKEELPKTEEK